MFPPPPDLLQCGQTTISLLPLHASLCFLAKLGLDNRFLDPTIYFSG